MSPKHIRVVLGLVVALSVFGAACGVGAPGLTGKAEPDKVTFRLGFFLAGGRLPFVAALEKGYYKAENLDVDMREGQGGIANAQLVANGDVMIAEGDASTVASLRDRGINLKVIYTYGQKSSIGIVGWRDRGVNSPKDLAGKTLGVTPGEVPLLLLPAYLSAIQVEPSSVRQVPLEAATKFTAFLAHQTDAATTLVTSLPPPYFTQQDQFSVLLYADAGLAMLSESLFVSEDTFKNKPDVLKRFLRATSKGFSDCEADPVDCAKYSKQFKETADPETLVNQWKLAVPLHHTAATQGKPIGWMAESDWVDTLATLKKSGLLNTPTQPSDVYTNDLVPS